MNKEPINIVLASDDNYAQPLGVSIYSLIKNFSSNTHILKITILDGGISHENINKLKKICSKFETQVNFIKIKENTFEKFPTFAHFTKAIYYRILIPELFEEGVNKVIYLDCDILVLGNIADLYKTDINNFYFGAVKDFTSEQILNSSVDFYKEIKKIFNSGVLIMNLKKIKEEKFIEKVLSFIEINKNNLKLPDQDALNYISIDKWLEIDKVWNYQIDRSQNKITPQPKILHYTHSYKPWHAFYYNYYQNTYIKYLKEAWPNHKIKPVSFLIFLKQILKRIPFSVFIVRKIKKIIYSFFLKRHL